MATEAMVNKSPMELLVMGKKAFWAHEYSDAAAYLSRSSEMLMDEYKDDKHNSLGDVYLYYGKALLELVREDGDPLGDAVPKEIELEDETAEEDVGGDQDDEADPANESADAVSAGGDGDEKTGKDDQDDAKKKTELANISINGEPATSRAMEDDEEGETPAEDPAAPKEEEPTDLQLAWEVLEMAKIILDRRGEEGRLDYADCLVVLGEVSMEGENFESAISDITEALHIQEERYTESKDKRHLAETYYKLGMALSANYNIQESIDKYRKTVELLKSRLTVLEAIEKPGNSDANEIKDITNLLPDLDEKITDLYNYQTEAPVKPEEEVPTVSSPVKQVNNITHLVRRKRKLEDVAVEAAETAAKKAAADAAVTVVAASSCSSSSSSSGSASSTNTSTSASASPDASSTSSSSNASN